MGGVWRGRWPTAVALGVCLHPGCTVSPAPALRHHVEATVDAPVPAVHGLAERVWGEAPAAVPPAQSTDRGPQDPARTGPLRASALRAKFGPSVLIAPDGTITKQYFVTGETSRMLLNLLRPPAEHLATPEHEKLPATYGPVAVGGGEAADCVLAEMLGEQRVDIFFVRDFEKPRSVQIRGPNPAKNVPISGAPEKQQDGTPNSLLVVSAPEAGLVAFEDALDLFFGSIPQIEIEVRVVEYSTSDTLAFGISPAVSTVPPGPTLTNLSDNKLVQEIVAQFPLAAPLVGSASIADRGIVALGGIHDSWQLTANLQALEAQGEADIISNPRLAVRNGGLASIVTRTEFPYPDASISSSGQNVTSNIKFRPVGVTLNIRPVIAGTQTVILQIYANISVVTSFASTQPVNTPIVSNREVVTSVHVASGKTTVIGGLVSTQEFEQTAQVPILGDIPILGYLFRSTSTTQSRTTLDFHITPRIVQGPRSYVGT